MKQYHLKCDEMEYHKQVQGIVRGIEDAIALCEEKDRKCLLFIDRIDTLWESVAWHDYGRVKVANTLKKLKFRPVFLLATAGKALDEIEHVDGLRHLFINPERIAKLPRPNQEDQTRLFMQIFKQRPEFRKAFNDFRDRQMKPIGSYDLEILKTCFGDEFGSLMKDFVGTCHEASLVDILSVHGYLYSISHGNTDKNIKTALIEIQGSFRQVLKQRFQPKQILQA